MGAPRGGSLSPDPIIVPHPRKYDADPMAVPELTIGRPAIQIVPLPIRVPLPEPSPHATPTPVPLSPAISQRRVNGGKTHVNAPVPLIDPQPEARPKPDKRPDEKTGK